MGRTKRRRLFRPTNERRTRYKDNGGTEKARQKLACATCRLSGGSSCELAICRWGLSAKTPPILHFLFLFFCFLFSFLIRREKREEIEGESEREIFLVPRAIVFFDWSGASYVSFIVVVIIRRHRRSIPSGNYIE